MRIDLYLLYEDNTLCISHLHLFLRIPRYNIEKTTLKDNCDHGDMGSAKWGSISCAIYLIESRNTFVNTQFEYCAVIIQRLQCI